MSIRMRLTLWYSTVFGATLLFLGMLLYFFLAYYLRAEIDQALARQAAEVVKSIRVVGHFPLPLRKIVLPDVDVFAAPDTYLQIVDNTGEVMTRSRNLGSRVLPLGEKTLRLAAEAETFYETITTSRGSLRIYNYPLMVNNQVIGLLQVGRSLQPVDTALGRMRWLLLTGSGIGLLLAATVGWFLAGAALRPIDRVTQTAAEIEEARDLERRIDYNGPPDEIGRLVATFNDMLTRIQAVYQRLEESYAVQKRFVADASHELRTPLTTIRGNVELLQKIGDSDPEMFREVLADIASETERMSRLVKDMLALARADAGLRLEKEPLSLKDLVQEVIRQGQLRAGEVDFGVDDLTLSSRDKVLANADYLKEVFLILLDNAFKYTPAGGRVSLGIYRKNERWAGIWVADTGIGIEAKDLPHIFERFYRADRARREEGTGLGLAIAKWIVEEHGGRIEVESTPGKGSIFTVWLPLLRS
ncbi:sensor histidine kinase [Calderihabitans maritimus]|uniref:histidine kinase n=1 Tax=Calderihabitans maritimus TaxID=1246530 RepID=A0A1Z5HRW0_9FIRM|nr:HAMP domain-containing sensor histidine kinase [Calderihabitans maritimus]GAW92061.1 signal transduction histidine kinase [Calderihabitans maritimus]